jgi:toxin ParE1/3/4
MKSVTPHEQANLDVDEAIEHYLKDGAPQAALGLVDALEDAYALLGRHPGLGSSRYAYELDIPGLRTWPLRRFPYLIFYAELADRVDVWRVLHNRRDIPTSMQGLDLYQPYSSGQLRMVDHV